MCKLEEIVKIEHRDEIIVVKIIKIESETVHVKLTNGEILRVYKEDIIKN